MVKQVLLLSGLLLTLFACDSEENSEVLIEETSISATDSVEQKQHLVNDYPPFNSDGSLNVLIEIPAGTIQKWEVNKETGALDLELIKGMPRTINYLPYPGNYGLIPQTLLPKKLGGDGDPLDVIILGEALVSGEFYACKLIGVLNLLDRGEQDDKLIAVLNEGPFAHINSMAELDAEFVGVSSIVETWFANYKGEGMMESQGFAEKEVADSVLAVSIAAFK